MSTFSGLSLGSRALETQKKSLDVTGHNIANANNEDYNKQRAVHSASYPHTKPGMSTGVSNGQVGTGVEIEKIERVKDQFIGSQISNETQTSGYWKEMTRGLEKVEHILNEPSDSGIDTAIDEFWNSLQDLSSDPNDTAARNMVRESARSLIDSFQSVDGQLLDYKESIDENLNNAASDINQLSTKIADLNKQIVSVKGSRQNPNDLLDERDALYKEMNEMLNVRSREDDQGNLIVSTAGKQLVNGSDAYELEVEKGEPGEFNSRIKHSRSGTEINPDNGKLAAWTEMRDEKLDFYRGKLDKLAENMVNEFNSRHKKGYDAGGEQGENFFNEIPEDRDRSAVDLMSLTNQIEREDGLDKIAAGNYSGEPGIVEIDNIEDDAAGDYTVDIVENDAGNYDLSVYALNSDQVLAEGEIEAGESASFNLDDVEFDSATGEVIDQAELKDPGDGDFDLTPKDSGTTDIGLENNSGSGDNASFMADLFDDSKVMDGTSVKGYFRTIVSTAGAETQRASEMEANQEQVLKQLDSLDRSVSGVSLDEEMAKLIKYQQSYNAAAKYITKTDELLETLMTIV